jgi:TfoX/Sxy family transcriptional regulator of competence genes
MAYDDGLAERLREFFQDVPEVVEKKMFGGLAFMVRGNMCVGVVNTELMVRTGPDGYEEALLEPNARKMDFTGKPMRGFVYISEQGFESDRDLTSWIDRAMGFVDTLPSK